LKIKKTIVKASCRKESKTSPEMPNPAKESKVPAGDVQKTPEPVTKESIKRASRTTKRKVPNKPPKKKSSPKFQNVKTRRSTSSKATKSTVIPEGNSSDAQNVKRGIPCDGDASVANESLKALRGALNPKDAKLETMHQLQLFEFMNEKELTPMQQCFVVEYLIDFSAGDAANRAGYSTKYGNIVGPQLLRKPHVREVVRFALGLVKERKFEFSEQWLIDQLLAVTHCDVKNYMAWKDDRLRVFDSDLLDKHESIMIQEISQSKDGIKLKLRDKDKAVESLAKIHEMFKDTLNVNVNQNNPMSTIDLSKLSRKELLFLKKILSDQEATQEQAKALKSANPKDYQKPSDVIKDGEAVTVEAKTKK